jgi:hypothetical protein
LNLKRWKLQDGFVAGREIEPCVFQSVKNGRVTGTIHGCLLWAQGIGILGEEGTTMAQRAMAALSTAVCLYSTRAPGIGLSKIGAVVWQGLRCSRLSQAPEQAYVMPRMSQLREWGVLLPGNDCMRCT